MNRRALTTAKADRQWSFWAGYYAALRMAAMSDARTATHVDVRCIYVSAARKWNRELVHAVRRLREAAV